MVFSALDNLVKGAAGQAVQNMNLMFGLEEKTGLMLIGTNPAEIQTRRRRGTEAQKAIMTKDYS